jgi:hypothetical protein
MNAELIRRRLREIHASWSPYERLARAEVGRRRAVQFLKLIAPVHSRPAAKRVHGPVHFTAR